MVYVRVTIVIIDDADDDMTTLNNFARPFTPRIFKHCEGGSFQKRASCFFIPVIYILWLQEAINVNANLKGE